MLRKSLIATIVAAGLASPAAATVLDFTSSGIGVGNTTGNVAGVGYTITGSSTLTDATHDTSLGCNGAGWNFACDVNGNRVDVGFGVQGSNNNEIDGINSGEYVQVAFTNAVRILGFAGMLTYNDSQSNGLEWVVLEYSMDGGLTFSSLIANALNDDNDPHPTGDNLFDVVGLAFRDDINVTANVVRFRAGGTFPFDDGNANVTAAALNVAPIPVPAALPLLMAGLGALGFMARRRKTHAG